MTTTTYPDDVRLPAGADHASEGDEEGSRVVYGEMRIVDTLSVRSVVSQLRDGSMVNVHGDRALVWLDQIGDPGDLTQVCDLIPDDARRLATALLAAASQVDGWAAR